MPSIKSRILKATLKTVSPLVTRADVEFQRKQLDFVSSLKKQAEELRVTPVDLDTIRAERIDAETLRTPVVLYFHGGAYVSGSLLSGRVLAGEFAHTLQCSVLSFEYRLAPEHPFPAALQDALSAYQHLLESGLRPEEIIFAGESAGGGLCLAAVLALRRCAQALPAALVCLSPWGDLTCTGASHRANRRRDPLLNTAALLQSARQYAGMESLTCPLVSPAYGDFAGFPPVLIQAGGDEVLLSDAQALANRLREDGADVTLSVYEGMWHVWQAYDIPEAHEALREIADFVQEKTAVRSVSSCENGC